MAGIRYTADGGARDATAAVLPLRWELPPALSPSSESGTYSELALLPASCFSARVPSVMTQARHEQVIMAFKQSTPAMVETVNCMQAL